MDDPQTQDNQPEAGKTEGAGTNGFQSIMDGMTDPAPSKEEGQTENDNAGSEKEGLPKWTESLADELKNNGDVMKQLAKFKEVGDLAKSYSELEKKLGKSIAKPGDDASDEEKQAFFEKLGKPSSAEGYSIADENAKEFREIAFKNNLTDEQAKGIFEAIKAAGNAFVQEKASQVLQSAQETENILRKEYGNHFDEKMTMLQRGVQSYGGASLAQKLKSTGLLYDAEVAKMFIKLGEMNAEAGTFSKGTSNIDDYKSSAEGGMFEFKGL